MTSVRLAESALADIARQLRDEEAIEFLRLDVEPVLDLLRADDTTWPRMTAPHGPGRRLTVSGRTVAGFHLFGVDDPEASEQPAVVIYFIDIWASEFP